MLIHVRPHDRDPDSYCQCGWSLGVDQSKAEHRRHHRMMSSGLYAGDEFLRNTITTDGIAVIPCFANSPVQKRIYQLMHGFKVYQGFDSVQWPAVKISPADPLWVKEHLLAIVHTSDRGANEPGAAQIDGWMLLRNSQRVWRIDIASRRNSSPDDGEKQYTWSVAAIYTPTWDRRKGYARRLLEAAARYGEIPLRELAFDVPLSEKGWALAVSISNDSHINVCM